MSVRYAAMYMKATASRMIINVLSADRERISLRKREAALEVAAVQSNDLPVQIVVAVGYFKG